MIKQEQFRSFLKQWMMILDQTDISKHEREAHKKKIHDGLELCLQAGLDGLNKEWVQSYYDMAKRLQTVNTAF